MGNSSLRTVTAIDREVAALLIEVFRPRLDLYAWRIDDADTAARLDTWEGFHRPRGARVWRVGDWRPAGAHARRRPVTVDDVALHVAGLRTLGFYPMHPDGTCNSVSADFDDHRGAMVIERDPREDFEALMARIGRDDIPCLAHRSRGGRGYWVHLLPPKGTPARDARRLMHGLLREAGVRDVSEGGTFDGLFPKQDDAPLAPPGDPTARPGNLFCLPLSRRWLANDPPGGCFVGVDPHDFGAQVYALWKARRVTAAQWRELSARFEHDLRPSAPRSRAPRRATARTPRPSNAVAPSRDDAHEPISRAWEIALRRAHRVGRPLGEGRHALLCVNDAQHSAPDGSVENARGSCVLFPPSAKHPKGFPWCAHAHCARLTERDWITALGRDAWDDACLAARGMRRAGPWLLHPGGISTWFRDVHGAITPSRRERLCEVPLWIVEDTVTKRGPARVVDAVVGGRTRRITVPASRFASMAWLTRVGVDADAMMPAAKARLVEAIERLSEPVPRRDVEVEVDQMATQARAAELLSLLAVMLDASGREGANDTGEEARDAKSG